MQEENKEIIFNEPGDSTNKKEKVFKRIFKNFSFLTLGKIAGDFFAFILFIVLTRKYGQEGIGQYSFAVGFTGYFAMLAQFGLIDYTIKEISRNKNHFEDYFQRIFTLSVFLSVLMTLILLLIIPFLSFSTSTKIVLVISGTYQIIYYVIDILISVFIAYELMHIAGILSVTTKIATSVFALTIALSGGSIELSLLCLPIISLIQLFIILRLARRKFGHIRIARSFDLLKKTFKELIPFGMTDFLFQVYSRTDVVLIGFMLGESASGIYNVGFRIIFFLLFIPNFAALAIFPTVSQLYKESRFEFTKMYNNSLGMLVMIGLPISAGVCLIAPQIIHMLFGPEFNKSALILEISSVIFLSKCINNIMTIFLMSCDRQKKVSSSSWIVTVFSVITLPVFIYFWNIEGAAFGVTLSSILFSVLLAINLKPVTGYPKIKLKALISISGVAAFYIVFMFFDTTIFIIIPGAIIIYLAVLLLFKPIRDNELKMILNLLNFQKNSLEHS